MEVLLTFLVGLEGSRTSETSSMQFQGSFYSSASLHPMVEEPCILNLMCVLIMAQLSCSLQPAACRELCNKLRLWPGDRIGKAKTQTCPFALSQKLLCSKETTQCTNMGGCLCALVHYQPMVVVSCSLSIHTCICISEYHPSILKWTAFRCSNTTFASRYFHLMNITCFCLAPSLLLASDKQQWAYWICVYIYYKVNCHQYSQIKG